MKRFLGVLLVIGVVATSARATNGIDLGALEQKLKGEGLVGWIHGSVAEYKQYVFTYRDPENFFNYAHFPIVSPRPSVHSQLQTLHRHDLVRVWGRFNNTTNPQRHVRVSRLEVVKRFEVDLGEYERTADIPSELRQSDELIGKVHAVFASGQVLVIEYKDAVLPVVVDKPEMTAHLYRNDKIRLRYQVRESPSRPAHLWLDVDRNEPLKVLEPIADIHETQGELVGYLVKFPKSPQLKFDVYALQVIDSDGVKRNFTLVNFEDFEVFKRILKKLEKIWNAHQATAVNGRNKWVNYQLRLKATGIFNLVSPSQANPQILLESVDSIKIDSEE